MKKLRWPFAWRTTVDARDAEIVRLTSLQGVEASLELQGMLIQMAHAAAERELNLTDTFARFRPY
jgi:hypothetical protein